MSLLSIILSFTVGDYVRIFLLFLFYYFVRLLRNFLKADADLSCLRAAQRIPKKAFQGKVVWITGASSGIGEAIAYDMVQRGAKVILSARRTDELTRVKDKCLALCPGRPANTVFILPLDLLSYDTHKKKTEEVIAQFGHIDVLINNGGRSQRALIEKTELQVDQDMLALNTLGTLSLTKAVLPYMLEAKTGRIVVISSVSGKMGAPVSGSYSMSKHALQGFFDTLRLVVAGRGVGVTIICPGPVQSQGSVNAFTDTANGVVGEHKVEDGKKMTGARCAELIAGATAHNLDEAWVSRQPILAFTYLSQYAPNVARRIGAVVAEQRVNAFLAGDRDINAGLKIPIFKTLRTAFFSK